MSLLSGFARLFAVCAIVLGLTSNGRAQQLDLGPLGGPELFGSTSDAEAVITATLKKIDAETADLAVTVTLPEGFYTYSMNPSFGAATVISLTDAAGLELSPEWKADRDPKAGFDKDFGQDVEKFHDKVTWTNRLKGKMTSGLTVSGKVDGQFCGDGSCRPYRKAVFTAQLEEPASGQADETPPKPAASDEASPGSVVRISPKIGTGKSAKEGLISFEIELAPADAKVGDEIVLTVKSTVQDPWHTFALDQDPEMAGLPTVIEVNAKGLEDVDKEFTSSNAPEIEKPLPEITQRVHYESVTWSRRYKLTGSSAEIDGSVRFQICREGTCLRPTTVPFRVVLGASRGSSGSTSTSDTQTPPDPVQPDDAATASGQGQEGTKEPGGDAAESDASSRLKKDGLLAFVLAAIGAGFAALATPCVFPMIPITVAFFLKQEEKRAGSSLSLALVYCLSIVGAFTFLGVITAAIFGPSKLNELANGPALNLIFGALFILFALILVGLVNVQIPSWVLTWTSSRESAGGLAGVVFMALTFTLVSFTCTFAFVGGILVVAAQGDYLWPVVGMLCFSTAFASPFFVLAMFPRLVKSLPRSGGWMEDVKVVLGIVELGAAAKFLSVADIKLSPTGMPRLITYNGFLWFLVVLAVAAALVCVSFFNKYATRRYTVPRLFFAGLFLLFGLRVAAGAFNAPLPQGFVWNTVSAFAPPPIRDGDVIEHAELGLVLQMHGETVALEFDKAVAHASKEERPLFLDVTGVNCINCRLMERTVLIDPKVTELLGKTVQAQLYVDQVPGVRDMEKEEALRERNNEVALNLLDDVTMPTYAIVSPDGKQVLAVFKGLDSSGGADFVRFLNSGLARWEKSRSARVAAK